MQEKKIHEALEAAINSDPIKQKAFDDMQKPPITSDKQREELITNMSKDIAHEIGGHAVLEKIGAKLGHHGDTEKSYEKMDAKFDKALEKHIPDPVIRAAIAQEAADNYVTGVHGKKFDPNHHEALQAMTAEGIQVEVSKGVDAAFNGGIKEQFKKVLPEWMAGPASHEVARAIDADNLKYVLTASVNELYRDPKYQAADPATKHAMAETAVKEALKEAGAIDVKQTKAGTAAGKVLEVAEKLPLLSNLGLGDYAQTFEGTAKTAIAQAIATQVADKMVPSEAKSQQQNLYQVAEHGIHDVMAAIATPKVLNEALGAVKGAIGMG